MTVKQRLIQFINYKNLSIRAFEKSIPLSNGYINNISQSISETKLQTISLRYPDLNPAWLLLGIGEMLKDKIQTDYKEVHITSHHKEPDLPHVNVNESNQIEKAILLIAETNNKLAEENRQLHAEVKELRRENEEMRGGRK